MKASLWVEVKRVFGEALDVPAGSREAFVHGRCESDEKVRDEVLRMLRRRAQLTSFLEPPRDATAAPLRSSESVGPEGRGFAMSASAEDGGVGRAQSLAAGAVLVGRYELGPRLGAGAFGAVHRAKDKLTGQDVAVKLLPAEGGAHLRALRRESAVLRRARLPGVVELLDDGVEHGWAFLVMKLVDGAPFPGRHRPGPVAWDDLGDRALRLLEAAGRLHWLGVLHRDLKPENVLVDDAGRVTIVDLGIADEADRAAAPMRGWVAGTPAYLAPERLRGESASIASDLYAIGVMLWEALAGGALHECESFDELLELRAHPPRRVDGVVSDVPKHVADALARMLAPDPAARPRSVREAVSLLRNGVFDPQHLPLPWVGEDSVVRAVVDAVRTRRPLDLAGPKGCGRTRSLEEAARRLTDEGRDVRWTRAGTRPFESLVPVVGELPQRPELTLDDLRAWLRRCLGAWLEIGLAIFADDWNALDAHTREVLTAVGAQGPLVRVLDGKPAGALVPPPRTEEDLRALFHGPDRILHLREDGARELSRRTAGRPGECVRELIAWIDGGIARWEDGLCRIDRAGIERLETGLSLTLPRAECDVSTLSQGSRTVQAVLETAGCPLALATIAQLVDQPRWEVEALLAPLVALGVAQEEPAGTFAARARTDAGNLGGDVHRHRVHLLLAATLPSGSDRRAFHLAASGATVELVEEMAALARRKYDQGRLDAARYAARLGLSAAADDASDRGSVVALALILLDCALHAGSLAALDEAIADLSRVHGPASGALDEMRLVASAARHLAGGDQRRALAALWPRKAMESAEVERRAWTVRCFASRRNAEPATTRAVHRDALRWIRSHRATASYASAFGWMGWIRYDQGRFLAAARLHARAARLPGRPHTRCAAWLHAASAHMEAGDLAGLSTCAARGRDLALGARIPHSEARGDWLLRCLAYRRGLQELPDTALVDAARDACSGSVLASIALTEAAIARRSGALLVARALARLAAESFASSTSTASAYLARALDVETSPAHAEQLENQIDAIPWPSDRMRDQVRALLAIACVELVGEARGSGAGPWIREVLSDAEVAERLGAEGGTT